MKYTQEQIIDLAKSVELDDAIDWSDTNLDRERIYQIVGSQAYEIYSGYDANHEAILLATVIKLLVENFVLNLKATSI